MPITVAGQLALLREGRASWATATDEVLRFDSPVQRTARFAMAPTAALTFGDARDSRPAPRTLGGVRTHERPYDQFFYSDLTTQAMARPGLQAQLFNRWLDPVTMLPCGGDGTLTVQGHIATGGTDNGPRCARFQGGFVEHIADGRLMHILTHGIGIPRAMALRRDLLAMGGQAEDEKGTRDDAQMNYVSLWNAAEGRWLANLPLPKGDARISALLFSDDGQRLYGLLTQPQSKLFVWHLHPAWSGLAGAR